MTTPTTTPTTPLTAVQTSPDGLAGALDVLAAAAEQAHDDARTRAVLSVVVQRLEQAAGAELGDTDGEPLVVLQRRFGRAHARVTQRAAGALHAALLHDLARALQLAPCDEPRLPVRTTCTAVAAVC